MNRLYYGDNLAILRDQIAAESVDLVYLDPPFNSNATNVLFKAPSGEASRAQIEAFEDTWHWNDSAEEAYWQVLHGANTDAAKMLEAMRGFLGQNDMMAYLAMMAVRLIELHKVLKPTGSLYLHCDPVASHYLKILLDSIFGPTNFRSEIIWKRTSAHSNVYSAYGDITDTIFFYSKGSSWTWNQLYRVQSPSDIERAFPNVDPDGRRWRSENMRNPGIRPNLHYPYTASNGVTYQPHPNGWTTSIEKMKALAAAGKLHFPAKPNGRLRLKFYADGSQGIKLQNLWDDISAIGAQAQERLGYPTQKPLALLERIISASSNEGDVVLDPFCGCGTTVHAAQKLGRQWIGIDVTHLAISLIERRLEEAFPGIRFETIGVPRDVGGARALAERDKHEFQKWAITLIPDAQPWKGGKKGADTGIDGIVYLRTGKNQSHRGIIEVKGGEAVGVDVVHKLKSVIEREKALVGILISLNPPSKAAEKEAVAAGFAEVDMGTGTMRLRRVQILTVEQLMTGARAELPIVDSTAFRRAPREETTSQPELDF